MSHDKKEILLHAQSMRDAAVTLFMNPKTPITEVERIRSMFEVAKYAEEYATQKVVIPPAAVMPIATPTPTPANLPTPIANLISATSKAAVAEDA